MKYKLTLVILMSFFSSGVIACLHNADCQPGSQCLKPIGQGYGVCVGGPNPGAVNDKNPGQNPRDFTGQEGKTCVFDAHCGPNVVCVKQPGFHQGVCLRR